MESGEEKKKRKSRRRRRCCCCSAAAAQAVSGGGCAGGRRRGCASDSELPLDRAPPFPSEIMDPRQTGFSFYSNSESGQNAFAFAGSSDEQFMSTQNQSPMSGQPQTDSSIVRRPIRSSSFSVNEDLMLISAWINISTDPVSGTDQRRDQFWKRIYDFYHEHKNFVSDRTQNSLGHRWSVIQQAVSKFQACYVSIEDRRQSGLNEQDKIQQAKALYCSLQKVGSFNFEHCWNELRYQPKWMEDSVEKMSKKKKSQATSSPATSSPASSSPSSSTPQNITDENEGFVQIARPPGRKAEKDRRRKSKSNVDDGNRDVSLFNLIEKMQDKKLEVFKQTLTSDADRLAADNARIEADNARTNFEKAKFESELEIRRAAEEERIMTIELEKLPPIQAQYYAARQKEILARTVGSSGFFGMH